MKWFLFNKVNLVSFLLGQTMLMLIVSCLTIVYVGLVIIVYIKSKKSGGFDNLPFVKNMWYFLLTPALLGDRLIFSGVPFSQDKPESSSWAVDSLLEEAIEWLLKKYEKKAKK